MQALLVGLGFEEEATTAVSRKSIVVNFSTLDREIDAEPRYQSLLRSLDDIARNEAINILVHHPDKRAFSVTKK